jgi:predicted enzyme related to lactoylglutathione lyase
MGEVDRYPNGTFCWIDLGTTDLAGATAFYGGLFGWEFADAGGEYTMCRLDGKDVTGMHVHGEEEGARWSSYISVDDVDAATTRARDLGATVVVEPSDVPGAARLSVIRDPSGAEVSLWQAVGHNGAGLVNEVGTWSWNELTSPDVDASKSFYGGLFGWVAEDVPAGIPRASFSLGDLLIGGAHAPTPQEGDAPRWTVSFMVGDAGESAERVQQLGGRVLLPPMDIPAGKFAIVSDPGGAPFTIAAVPGGAFRGVDGS